MKTPCQDNPEAWVSDFADVRAEAAAACQACPALQWCATRAALIAPTWGVWAGRDYSPNPYSTRGRPRNDARLPALPPVKTCLECGNEFSRGHRSRAEWAMKATCSRACTWKRKRKASAA